MEEKDKNNNFNLITKKSKTESQINNVSNIKTILRATPASFTVSKQSYENIKRITMFNDFNQKLIGATIILKNFHSSINAQANILSNQLFINSITKPLISESKQLIESMKSIAVIQATIANNLIKKTNFSPFFKELYESLDEARKNPHSFLNWYNYYEKLSDYFWVYPYDMRAEQLYKILEDVTSEKEFDRYMSHYFSKKKIKKLLSIIKKGITRKHKKMISQIEKAYDIKLYALANNNLIIIIDDLLSFYIYNKSCTQRYGIFEPIIEDLKEKHIDISYDVLITLMINSYINKLYDSINFNTLKIDTHKKSRRGASAHGKFTSNERSDFIMLINTVYHLLIAQKILKKYKGRIFRKRKNFYIPKGKEYIEMKRKVDKAIENELEKEKNNHLN